MLRKIGKMEVKNEFLKKLESTESGLPGLVVATTIWRDSIRIWTTEHLMRCITKNNSQWFGTKNRRLD
ncbi:MAG: hypothetical protein HQ557_11190 [Bacteroidetes bacterium]|nr:hypothetical protein [Bacteroidota bacterium]